MGNGFERVLIGWAPKHSPTCECKPFRAILIMKNGDALVGELDAPGALFFFLPNRPMLGWVRDRVQKELEPS